jgi:hypothetical protein
MDLANFDLNDIAPDSACGQPKACLKSIVAPFAFEAGYLLFCPVETMAWILKQWREQS